jgi:hypothetical protein
MVMLEVVASPVTGRRREATQSFELNSIRRGRLRIEGVLNIHPCTYRALTCGAGENGESQGGSPGG